MYFYVCPQSAFFYIFKGCSKMRLWLASMAMAALTPATVGRRIKVQHLSPFLGRHNGGLLVNVTGQGANRRSALGHAAAIVMQHKKKCSAMHFPLTVAVL